MNHGDRAMGWHLTDLPRAGAAILFHSLSSDRLAGRAVVEALRHIFLSGASVTAPFVVSLVVLGVVLDFVGNLLWPLARILTLLGLTGNHRGVIAQGLTVAMLVALVFLIGVLAEAGPTIGLQRGLGRVISAVPGIGSVYTSFERMSDVMLDSDGQSFREVKLIEFPHTGIYSLAFQTAAVHATATSGDDQELLVLFVPLAPNPVMGGFLVCVPAHRVRDVDLTVQEAFQAIVTSGVVMNEPLKSLSNEHGT